MAKANLDTLSSLHEKLADQLIKALEHNQEANALLEEFREELPLRVKTFLESLGSYNPSLYTSAAKFLKDNNITVAVEDSSAMSALEERLAKKRVRTAEVIQLGDQYA